MEEPSPDLLISCKTPTLLSSCNSYSREPSSRLGVQLSNRHVKEALDAHPVAR